MNKVEFSRTAKVPFAKRYDNFVGGEWVAPKAGKYFENLSPVNGRPLCEIARSQAEDVETALDAAHKAKEAWGRTAPAQRALILNRIADRIRYCYYVSRQFVEECRNGADGWRLPAHQLDSVVERRLTQILNDHAQLSEWIREWMEPEAMTGLPARAHDLAAIWQSSDRHEQQALLKRLVRSIALRPGSLTIGLDRRTLAEHLFGQSVSTGEATESTIIAIACPIGMRRRGVETRLVLTDGSTPTPVIDSSLVDLLRRAHRYLAQITDGSERSLKEVAQINGTDASEISRLLPLAFLAPRMVEKVLNGTQPVELTALKLSRAELPHLWTSQATTLGC